MDPIITQSQEPQYQAPMSEHKHFLNKKFIVAFVILILLGSGAYAGIWYWQNQQVANEVVSTFTPRPLASAIPISDTSTWKTYTGTSFEVKYPENIFTMFDIRKYSGAQYKRTLIETELISTLRASNIGKKVCSFSGLLGQVNSNQLCELGRESGISFTETDGPISDYTSLIEGDGGTKTTVTIGGKQFVKSSREFPDCTYPKDANGEEQKVCTDGTGLDIYYIALNENRTLMIFRNVQGGHYYPKQLDGFPQQSLVDQILSTLKFIP